MPTGYTDDLCEKEVPFETFVLRCARNFGALVRMRDEAMDAPIPERFEPNDFYDRQLVKNEAELAAVKEMTLEQAEGKAAEEYALAVAEHTRSMNRKAIIRERLLRVRVRVTLWVPPTADHVDLKRFMLQQIDETIKWDGTSHSSPPRMQSGKSWLADRIESLTKSVERSKEMRDEEHRRTEECNRWIADLRFSLKETAR